MYKKLVPMIMFVETRQKALISGCFIQFILYEAKYKEFNICERSWKQFSEQSRRLQRQPWNSHNDTIKQIKKINFL
jgi:hypothetical protein